MNQENPNNQQQPIAPAAVAPPVPAAMTPPVAPDAPVVGVDEAKEQAQQKVDQITKAGMERKEEVDKWKADEVQGEVKALEDMSQGPPEAEATPPVASPQVSPVQPAPVTPAPTPPASSEAPSVPPPAQPPSEPVAEAAPTSPPSSTPTPSVPDVAPVIENAEPPKQEEKKPAAPTTAPKVEAEKKEPATPAKEEPVPKSPPPAEKVEWSEDKEPSIDAVPFIQQYEDELNKVGVDNLNGEQKVLGAAFIQLRYELMLAKGVEPAKVKEAEDALLEILHDKNAQGEIEISDKIMQEIKHVIPAIESIVYEMGMQLAERGVKRFGDVFVPDPVGNDDVRDQEVQEIYARRMSMIYILDQVKKRIQT